MYYGSVRVTVLSVYCKLRSALGGGGRGGDNELGIVCGEGRFGI